MLQELKHYNHNHDPRNGRFTTSSGGTYYGEYSYRKKKININSHSDYNKKHNDFYVNNTKTLSTLSYDKNRTHNTDMFYATYTASDKAKYGALFNKPTRDENGYKVYKYRINNKLKTNLKVASEDAGASAFIKIYKNNGDFYNYVTDEERMLSYFADDKYKFRGYRDARKVIKNIQSGNTPSEKDLRKVYRIFNYTLPYDGKGNAAYKRDVIAQRNKFFDELKNNGYGAVLDTNDALYGGYKADAPIIVFDMEQIIPADVKQTSLKDVKRSTIMYGITSLRRK